MAQPTTPHVRQILRCEHDFDGNKRVQRRPRVGSNGQNAREFRRRGGVHPGDSSIHHQIPLRREPQRPGASGLLAKAFDSTSDNRRQRQQHSTRSACDGVPPPGVSAAPRARADCVWAPRSGERPKNRPRLLLSRSTPCLEAARLQTRSQEPLQAHKEETSERQTNTGGDPDASASILGVSCRQRHATGSGMI